MRLVPAFAAFLAFALPACADDADKPSFTAAIDAVTAACGAKPELTVDWDGFAAGEPAGGRTQALVDSKLTFLSAALSDVCADKSLRAKWKAQVRKILIRQALGAPDPMIWLNDGELSIDYFWDGTANPNATDVAQGITARLNGEPMEEP